jgi:hypothetical protein
MSELWAVLREALGAFYSRPLAVFALSSALVATVVLLLDMVATKLLDTTSLLKLGYGGGRTLRTVCLWGLGASLAAYLGGLVELFDVHSANARIIVGVAWPTVLPRIIALSTEASKEPEQDDDGVMP